MNNGKGESFANRRGAAIMRAALVNEVKDGTIPANHLREAIADELGKREIIERAVALIRRPEFQRAVDELVREHAKELVVEVLAERDGELESAVRRIVDERWEEAVRKAAHDILDAQLATIRRKLAP